MFCIGHSYDDIVHTLLRVIHNGSDYLFILDTATALPPSGGVGGAEIKKYVTPPLRWGGTLE